MRPLFEGKGAAVRMDGGGLWGCEKVRVVSFRPGFDEEENDDKESRKNQSGVRRRVKHAVRQGPAWRSKLCWFKTLQLHRHRVFLGCATANL